MKSVVLLLFAVFSFKKVTTDTCFETTYYWSWWVGWLPWTPWSSCDHTCGGGLRVRSRMCRHWNGVFGLVDSSPEREQTQCNQICLHEGQYAGGECKCVAGYKGYCCEDRPSCRPPCENGGLCVAEDTCNCLAGFYGNRCQTGGFYESRQQPKLHTTVPENDVYAALSWYTSPEFDSSNVACFVKIHVLGAPSDTLAIAESSNTSGSEVFGNFTMGPIDTNAALNESSRFACLQVRCPSISMTGEETDVMVEVSLNTGYNLCHVNNLTALNVVVSTNSSGSDTLKFVLENGKDYGPKYGVYISTGYRDKAVYLARQTCYSGYNFDFEHLNPDVGSLANFICTV